MKKLWPFLLIFLLFPFFIRSERIEHFAQTRPNVPPPLAAHPWIAQQEVFDISAEMVRDIEKVEAFCQTQKEDVTPILMRTLLALQADLPFHFPKNLYNVLCIGEEQKSRPYLYRVYKRVYFGETALGMPMYLDVRVFDASEQEVSTIVNWHLESIKGEYQPCGLGFFGHGSYQESDPTHGFAKKRAVYLLSHYTTGRLYVLYSDVPIENSEQLWQVVSTAQFLGD